MLIRPCTRHILAVNLRASRHRAGIAALIADGTDAARPRKHVNRFLHHDDPVQPANSWSHAEQPEQRPADRSDQPNVPR